MGLSSSMVWGGIDLGGTKIEARLFDERMAELARHRIATPTDTYDNMVDGIAQQIAWLRQQSADPVRAIGLGTPGLLNPNTGVILTANLPATGQNMARDINRRAKAILPNVHVHLLNDSRAATLSEATLGPGKSYRSVICLAIGTGVAGGHAIDGQLIHDRNGQNCEFGHLPLPAEFIAKHNLPLLPCACGLNACFETFLSGPGLSRLAYHKLGKEVTAEQIMTDECLANIKSIWLDLLASMIGVIARTSDPDIVILGGGVGMSPGLPDLLQNYLAQYLLGNTEPPTITQAQFGDASCALGAALYARQLQAAKMVASGTGSTLQSPAAL